MTISRRIAKGAGAATLSLAFLVAGTIATTPSTFAASPMAAGGKALVTNTGGDNIRVRQSAGTDSKQVAEAHEGETVTLLSGPSKDSNGNIWYKVQAPSGAGWIVSDFLKEQGGAPAQETQAASSAKATTATTATSVAKLSGTARVANTDGDPLRVRSAANSKGDVLTLLAATASVTVKAGPVVDSDNIAWYQISANGVTGWSMAQYLAQAQTPTAPVATPAPAAPAPAAAPAQPQPQKAATGPKLVGFARVANTDGDPLRLRSAASTSSSILTKLAANASVVIKSGPAISSDNVAWYEISANGATGWAMGQYLAQAQVAPDAQAQPTVQVKAAQAPVAAVAQPATQAAPAAPKAAPAAQPASVVGAATSSSVSQPATVQSSSKASTIVGIAMNYVGYRYVFGGTTPSGFDCSGFIYYVLNRAGKRVGRNMFDQLASGPRISSKNLQPGDLVFFSNTYKAGLSHAGIYIGNGKFVHAENESTGVMVSELWSSYWASHYTTAVRP